MLRSRVAPFESADGTLCHVPIHETAVVHADAALGRDVEIGPFTIVGANVRLGDNVAVGSHCELGVPTGAGDDEPLTIARDSTIRSHSVFYVGSDFGPGLQTGHHVTIRSGTRVGLGLHVGTQSDIQGDCVIRDHVRIHSNVFMGQLTHLESFVWVFPRVVFTNDPHPPSDGSWAGVHVEEYASIAAGATILPGVRVGSGSLIGANSLVNRDVPPETAVAGNPAERLKSVSDIELSDGSGSAYPWRRHFRRGYPEPVTEQWEHEFPRGESN